MGLRPGRCYRHSKKAAKSEGVRGWTRKKRQKNTWTRIANRKPRKNYIGSAPQLKIRQFNMGNPSPLIPYNTMANLRVRDGFDLRDNAIESSRMAINRKLLKDLGKDGYFMKVRVFPSNLLRENKQAQGAGADRVSQGMSLSFGIPIGRAARVTAKQIILSVLCRKGQELTVKKAMMRAKAKFPSEVYVDFTDNIKSIGTIPNKLVEEKVVAVEKTATESTAEAPPLEAGKTEGKAAASAKAQAGKTPASAAKPAGKK